MTISILALKGKLNGKILLLRFFFVGYRQNTKKKKHTHTHKHTVNRESRTFSKVSHSPNLLQSAYTHKVNLALALASKVRNRENQNRSTPLE